jgi:hypothetical protein
MTAQQQQPPTTPSTSRRARSETGGGTLSLGVRALLACDAAGWAVFVATFLIAGAARPGYDAWQQAISALSLGPGGWVQRVNFIGLGVLLIVAAVGWKRALVPGVGWRVYPWLKALTGVGLVGAGIFNQDPAAGYPLGAVQTPPTLHGDIHQICAFVSVTPLALGCFVLARRFAAEPRGRRWAAYAATSGTLILVFVSMFGALSTHGSAIAGVFERLMASMGALFSILAVVRWVWPTRQGRM